jgi:iron(III) transport system ATP-binding protein
MRGLAVKGVAKAFGEQSVLRGVDLVVPDGSFTAILGASGSGKTTLLRIVAGFERPDRGEVWLGDEIVDDAGSRYLACEQRRIGYVPQEGALFPHLSVGRNVGFGLPRNAARRKRVDALLELVGLAGYRRRYPHQLSGGQQQRVALARALAIEPEVVLLDEPFSSLDAALRASVRSEVLDVLRLAGTTSVLVTHDQDEALSMADQVAVLRDGMVAQLDSPAGLYGHPQDAGVAQFLGEANLIEGEIRDGVATTVLGRLPVGSWSGPSGPAHVMVRPEQIELGEVGEGTDGIVASYEYYGHDAIVRIWLERMGVPEPDAPELVVRITGGPRLAPGSRVGLSVRGPVVAWPARPGEPENSPE